ncbi:MAG: HAD-IC family P-type ATPase [Microbacteriaceae bacterium]
MSLEYPKGLTRIEVESRVRDGLANVFAHRTSRSIGHIIRANIFTLFNGVVGGAFIVLLIVGEWKDALFGIALLCNVAIGIVQELRSKFTLDRLVMLHQNTARVMRDSAVVEIRRDMVVMDDIVVVQPGDEFPADGVVVSESGLTVDESMLTGEAEPARKSAHDKVLAGSGVVEGTAVIRVTAVGESTYANSVAVEARKFSVVASELRDSLNTVVKWISVALIPLVAIIANGQIQSVGGIAGLSHPDALRDAIVGTVASVIGMVPQGLVLITSIAFAVSAVTLARRQVLVQELHAVEGLARVDVVCFDKTGTLTDGTISFDRLVEFDGTFDAGSRDAAIACFAHDVAANATAQSLRAHFEVSDSAHVNSSVPFNSATKWSSVTVSHPTGTQTWILGAPEIVLVGESPKIVEARESCAHIAATGVRVVALVVSDSEPQDGLIPRRVQAVAALVFSEQLRFDAHDTLRYFREQGVSVRVISGDNPTTVATMARRAGLEFDGIGFDSRELPSDIADIAALLDEHTVFGRVTPEQKRDMVIALQSRGHVVAMTGDGVNDALALKRADLGIAMGNGSAVTKAVSNVVLLDGRFSSLPGVVAEGRKVIANIERVSRLFLTKTSWAMTIAVVFGIALWSFPFLPRQLSAIDGFTIGLPSFALALLPNAQRYVPGFLRRSLMFCIPAGVVVGAAIVGINVWSTVWGGWSESESHTATSLVIAITGLWVLTGLSRPFTAPRAWIVAAMYVLCVAEFTVPLSTEFFGFTALSWEQLGGTLLVACAANAAIEVISRLVGRRTSAIAQR